MRYILIDPKAETITEGKFHKGGAETDTTLRRLYELLDCRLVQSLSFSRDVDFICDEEGTFIDDQYFFWSKSLNTPLAGKVALLGFDAETGSWTDCKLKISEVKKQIAWMGDKQTTNMILQMLAARQNSQEARA